MSNNQEKNNQMKMWLIILGIILFIVLIIVMLLFLMKGETKISQSEENAEMYSISCEADNVAYPFFTYDDSKAKRLKIDATFKNDTLMSISLVYALTYNNEDEAKKSELKNHTDFEVGIQNEGLTYASLNSDHKIMDNVYQLTIYNSGEELNRKIAKYYLLNSLDKYTQTSVGKAIAKKGLSCVNK